MDVFTHNLPLYCSFQECTSQTQANCNAFRVPVDTTASVTPAYRWTVHHAASAQMDLWNQLCANQAPGATPQISMRHRSALNVLLVSVVSSAASTFSTFFWWKVHVAKSMATYHVCCPFETFPGQYCVDGEITGPCAAGYWCKKGSPTPWPGGTGNWTNPSVGQPCPYGYYCLEGKRVSLQFLLMIQFRDSNLSCGQ